MQKLKKKLIMSKIIYIYCKIFNKFFFSEFVFGYSENHDLISGIAIWSLPTPCLFILNTTSFTYNLVYFLDSNNQVKEVNIDKILDDFRNNKLEVSNFRKLACRCFNFIFYLIYKFL